MPSPLSLLRAGPPPPKVALLPDALFFTRAVPITSGAAPAEAAAQIELALEAVSPFPLAQLYYGWFWTPGAEQAFVFAAYRRRFTSDQVALWEGSEVVLPTFAALVGTEVAPATTVVLTSSEGLTAVHWEKPAMLTKVVFRPLDLEATDDDRAKVRDELLREFEGSRKVIEVEAPLGAEPANSDREIVFRAGDLESRVPLSVSAALDVRDKGELAALRNAKKRDVLLWRVALGAAAALLLLVGGEAALRGGREWQKTRVRQYEAQKGPVSIITNMQELTNRIDDLRTKRLLPLEMVTQLVGENLERKPDDIQFTVVQADTTTRGLNTVYVQGKTNNIAQVNTYETTLRNVPSVEKVEAVIETVRGSTATFRLTVTFKPNTLKPTKVAGTTSL
jgi:hypothetical protein